MSALFPCITLKVRCLSKHRRKVSLTFCWVVGYKTSRSGCLVVGYQNQPLKYKDVQRMCNIYKIGHSNIEREDIAQLKVKKTSNPSRADGIFNLRQN